MRVQTEIVFIVIPADPAKAGQYPLPVFATRKAAERHIRGSMVDEGTLVIIARTVRER